MTCPWARPKMAPNVNIMREDAMTKVLRCRDVGVDCDFVARGATEEEILQKAREHARKDHGFQDIPPELVDKVKTSIRDE